MKINLISGHFYKYLISGIFVTTYSFLILSIFGRNNFLFTLAFVEISSHFIRWLFFEKFVFSDVKFKSLRSSFLKYFYTITAPYFLNIIFYIYFPFKKLFLNSLRVILISALVGFFCSKLVYLKKNNI